MSTINVDTDSVMLAAENIKKYNGKLDNNFSNVTKAISDLGSSWNGQTAQYAMEKFNILKDELPNQRCNIINNFVSFLINQVKSGYEITEFQDTSLANLFK